MRKLIATMIMTQLFAGWLPGCQKPLHFPVSSMLESAKAAAASAAYDTNGDGRADYFTFADSPGRINRIGYDTSGQGRPDKIVKLDDIDFRQCRHIVLILDGYGYQVVKDFYDAGGLRLFYPPSRVIAPYPTMTDLCIEDALGYIPCRGFEAKYYDRRQNKIVGGSWDYLAGKNEPYNKLLDYRAGTIWDAIGYLSPRKVFGKELNDCMKLYQRSNGRELLAYFVSSAGIGTIGGAEAQKESLKQVDRFVNQVIWQSRGLAKVTMLADHGHSYTPSTQIPLDKYLTGHGWRITNRLQKPRDVVYIRFGLETYASFASFQRAELAADLAACEGVTIASYAEGDAAVVLSHDGGKAVVRRKGDRYKYDVQKGDPLQLKDTLAKLTADGDGYFGADDLLAATVDNLYPDPLARLWRAHFASVENVPDVIISLEDKFYSGASSFGGTVKIASTHGGLNKANSTTFIISTIGPLPPFMRSSDIPSNMSKLTGENWPMQK